MDRLLRLFLMNEVFEAEYRLNEKVKRRAIRDASNPFELPTRKFIKLFRLPKNLTRDLIEEIRPFAAHPRRHTAIPLELKVFASLQFFAHGSYQTCTGDSYNLGISQKSVSDAIIEISDVVTEHLLERHIIFPQSQEVKNRIKLGFMRKFNFPGIIGAVDGTHVQIKAPPTEDEEHPGIAYYNRKGFYSINVQLICDDDLNILNCNARFPGSTHDSAIWALSVVREYLEREYNFGRLEGSWLIGDSGYALQPWLMTPIIDAADNTPEERYTTAHIKARNTIERCIGVLKQRFRCLSEHRVLHYDPVRAGKIIYTCAVLHNLVNMRVRAEPEEHNDVHENEENDIIDNHHIRAEGDAYLVQGRIIRARIVQEYFA